MAGFEPRTSGVRSDASANWAKTIAQLSNTFFKIVFLDKMGSLA